MKRRYALYSVMIAVVLYSAVGYCQRRFAINAMATRVHKLAMWIFTYNKQYGKFPAELEDLSREFAANGIDISLLPGEKRLYRCPDSNQPMDFSVLEIQYRGVNFSVKKDFKELIADDAKK